MKHFKIPKSLVDREQFVLNECKGRSVLHLGFADYPYMEEQIASGAWLHKKISGVARSCLGVDIDGSTVKTLREKYNIDNIVEGDAERLDKVNRGQYEVILAGEIIEHLSNPGMFLETAKSVLSPGGKLIITTANAFCLRRLIRIPFGYESVHPDHCYYFSHSTLHTLVQRYGYTLTQSHSYRLPNKNPILPYVVERFACMITPNWAEGIIHVYTMWDDAKNS